jgi:hypothetical protein
MAEFLPGEKFLIRGTYVVHRTSTCVTGMPQIDRDVAQLQHDLDVATRKADNEQIAHGRTRWAAHHESADQQTRISSLTVRLLAKDRDQDLLGEQVQRLRAELEQEKTARVNDGLRHALAVQHLQAHGAPSHTPERNSEQISESTKDDTEQRFSLLELD